MNHFIITTKACSELHKEKLKFESALFEIWEKHVEIILISENDTGLISFWKEMDRKQLFFDFVEFLDKLFLFRCDDYFSQGITEAAKYVMHQYKKKA